MVRDSIITDAEPKACYTLNNSLTVLDCNLVGIGNVVLEYLCTTNRAISNIVISSTVKVDADVQINKM